MRATVFVRYGGAYDLGHVAWAFDMTEGVVNAGSVENPSGHSTAQPRSMEYWDATTPDPMPLIRKHAYDALKLKDLSSSNIIAAMRTAAWIGHQAYHVFERNCLDDVYDVLRAYGVPNLPLPSADLLPDKWFIDFRGEVERVADYVWRTPAVSVWRRAVTHTIFKLAPAQMPTWRDANHPEGRELRDQLAGAPTPDPLLRGIDVSCYQGAIDWTAVAASRSVSFVYARVFHSPRLGDFGDDDTFVSNHDGCKHAGIPFGSYFFYMAAQNGAQQAEHFLEIANGRFGTLAPMVDVEEGSGDQGCGDSTEARIENLAACLERIAASLGNPIIYTNQDTWHMYFADSPAFSKYRLWVADHNGLPCKPTNAPRGWPSWMIHQYGEGQVAGIDASVDMDCLNAKGLAVIMM